MLVMEPIPVSKVHGVEVDLCVKSLQEIRRKGDGVRPRSIRSAPKEAMRSFIMYIYITPESEQTYQKLLV